MRPVAIRPARAEEAQRIAEIHVRAWQWAYRGLVPDPFLEGLSVENRAAYWRLEIAEGRLGHRHVWCAVRGADLLGFAAIGPSREGGKETGEVYAIYLEPNAVGSGVGRRLFAHVVDQLRRDGFRAATLWVLATNTRARRFYEGAGWRADGAEKTEDWRGTAFHEVRYRTDLNPKTSNASSLG